MEEDKKITEDKKENITTSDNQSTTAPPGTGLKVDTKPPEMVEIRKSKLDELTKRLDRLESAAHKGRLSRWDSSHKEDQQKIVKLQTLEGKVIERWDDMVSNIVEKHPKSGVWGERQIMRIYFFGEEEPKEVEYQVYVRRYQYLPCVVEEETRLRKQEDIAKYGNYRMKVRDFDGKEYTVGSKFIN